MAKRVLRKILRLSPEGSNSRGNPEHWRVLLECGHVKYDRHSQRQSMRLLAMAVSDDGVTATCRHCAEGQTAPHSKQMCMADLDELSGEPLAAVFDDFDKKGLNTKAARKQAYEEGRLTTPA